MAVAALADCSIAKPEPDRLKTDFTIGTHLEGPDFTLHDPQLNVQVKTCTSVPSEDDHEFAYAVDRALYDFLRDEQIGNPRFLIVIRIPAHPEFPLVQDQVKTTLSHAPFYCSLRGEAPLPEGQATTTIRIPKANLLTPIALRSLLEERGRRL